MLVIAYGTQGAVGWVDATTSGHLETSTKKIAYENSILMGEYTHHARKLLSLLFYYKYCKYWFVKSLASTNS